MSLEGLPLRPGLALREIHGRTVLVAPPGVHHPVPDSLVEALRAAVAGGAVADRETAGFLEARHLVETERVRRIEAWAARFAAPSSPPTLPLAGSRFTCHGCGACCESFAAVPVSEAERDAILA